MDGEKERTTEREEREGGMDGEKERVASTGDDATGGAKSRHLRRDFARAKKRGTPRGAAAVQNKTPAMRAPSGVRNRVAYMMCVEYNANERGGEASCFGRV